MPSQKQFKMREAYNAWYRKYRKKHREKLRVYNREYNRLYRAKNGYHNEEKWKRNNVFKRNAHIILQQAVAMGKVQKEPCKYCGSLDSVAHHPDYTKPLKVIWVCKVHHRKIHYGEKKVIHKGKKVA